MKEPILPLSKLGIYTLKPTKPSGEVATVTGWGRTTMGGSVSPVLLETNQTVLSNEQCNSAYGGIDEYCLS